MTHAVDEVPHAALQLLDRDCRAIPRCLPGGMLTKPLAEARQLGELISQWWDATGLQSGRIRLRGRPCALLPCLAGCLHARGARSSQSACFALSGTPTRRDGRRRSPVPRPDAHQPAAGNRHLRAGFRHHRRVFAAAAARQSVEVQGHGAGFGSSELPHLTRAFYRPPRDNRPSRGGPGLGLYLCRELARLHGGSLDVAPAPRRAHLMLSLPRAGAPRARVSSYRESQSYYAC
jgi:hypothetical protein